MAQRATGFAKRTSAATKTARAEEAAPRPIPIKLGRLLAPYKKHGRLSLRIEKLPRLARLSAGRNNGDGSWSLTLDQLEDLAYLPPDHDEKAVTLAVRVISINDSAATTLAVLDFVVSPNAAAAATHREETASAPASDAQTLLQRLNKELDETKAALAAREAELNKAREKTEAGGRAGRKAEPDDGKFASLTAELLDRKDEASAADIKLQELRLDASNVFVRKGEARPSMVAPPAQAERNAENEAELQRLRNDCAALKVTLAEREAALAQAVSAIEQAEQRWRSEAETALVEAERAWKESERARIAAAEAGWQEKSREALATVDAAEKAAREKDAERLRLSREECVGLQEALANRSTALAEAHAAVQQIRERAQRETDNALKQAEAEWKAAEAARLSAVEAKWQVRSAQEIAEANARCRQAEAALTDLRAQALKEAVAARDSDDHMLRQLREDYARVNAILAERETVLAQMRTAMEETRELWRRQSEADLKASEAAWNAAETARLATAEAEWRKQAASALGDVAARCERAEAALSQARVEARDTAARDERSTIALERLREEYAILQTALADREKAIEGTRLSFEQARESWRRESQAALAKATTAWKTDEAARFATVEAGLQEKHGKALAAMSAEAKAARDQADHEVARLREECATLQAALADRGKAIEGTRLSFEQARESWRRESQAALAKATTAWKTDEAARFATVEAGWQEKHGKALAAMSAEAKAARDQADREVARLREECAGLQAALAERDASVTQGRVSFEQAREAWRQESQATLAKATMDWKTDEAARAAAVEAAWQEKHGKALAEMAAAAKAARDHADREMARLREECAGLQAALADRDASVTQARMSFEQAREAWRQESDATLAKAKAGWTAEQEACQAAAEARRESDVRRLRDECAALQAALAERDAAIAQARLSIAEEREVIRREAAVELGRAKTAWQTEEAARLAAAMAQWQEDSRKAVAEARAAAEAAHPDAAELVRLRDESARLQASLAQRETQLTEMQAAAEAAPERWQRETQGAVLQAERAWKADESKRLAAAQAQWGKQSARALAEATSRFEAAEAALAQLRIRASSPRDDNPATPAREFAMLQATLLGSQAEVAQARAALQAERNSSSETSIVLRPNSAWDRPEQIGKARREKAKRPFGGVALAAGLAAAAILSYPSLLPMLPDSLRSRIAVATSEIGVDADNSSSAQSALSASPQANLAVVVQGANVRAGPSTETAVISTLQPGLRVATAAQRGNWTLVRLEGGANSREGWVYSSLLKHADGP